ncbi:MAG: protein translocase subunit SecD [Myxococcales bacterium]|nr:MAG: protein translocase subunit SecD [Myxococcales bacterium]
MGVDRVLTAVLGAFALILLLSGLVGRQRRLSSWTGAAFAGAAAFAAYHDAFWAMVVLGLIAFTAAFASVDLFELGWRLRFSLAASVAGLAFLVLWPTLPALTDGKVPCPAYIRDHVGFRLVAGLDLRGGLRLVYAVDVDAAIKDKRDSYYEDMRREAARVLGLVKSDGKNDEIPSDDAYAKLREKVEIEAPRAPANVIRVKVKEGTDPSKLDDRFLEKFRSELSFTRTADQRNLEFKVKSSVETSIRERAVGQAKDIIARRVDELGLREAAVSTREEDIIVEVPGEDEKAFSTIREIISKTARLEFKLLDDDTDFFGKLQPTLQKESLPEGLEFQQENAPIGRDEEGSQRSRTNTFAILNKLPNETTTQTLQRFREWVATLPVPADREIGYEVLKRTVDENTGKEEERGFRTFFLKSRAEVTGDQIRDAGASPQQGGAGLGGWVVNLTFNDNGGRIFERITEANVKRRFAIILDGRVSSAPVIQNKISGGHCQITLGSGDPEAQLRDARQLELVLRSGALPAPISPSNEQRIGASLGSDSIKLAVQGTLGGTTLVLLFMLVYYHRAGLIADIAVALNLFLQLAVLASFGASMTLPGIAGLALTVGMSVDNNILINERIREEIGLGKSMRAAVDVGYKRALAAIVDGHVTTVIAGVVLMQYGTGPLKGFAVTLMVGVICNVFTGVVVTRLMFDLWVRWIGRSGQLDMG